MAHKETELEAELRTKCEALDTEKTGIITVAELKKAISSLGEDIGEADLKEMIEEAKAGSGEENVYYKLLIAAMYADDEGAEEEEQ